MIVIAFVGCATSRTWDIHILLDLYLFLVVFDAVRWQMTFFVCTLICCTSLGPHFSFVLLFLFWVLELTLLIPAFLILFFWMKTNAGHKSRPEHGNHLMCNGIVPVPISPFFLFVYLLMPDLSLAVIPVFTHTHLSQPGPLPRRRIKLPNNTRSRVTSFSVCKQTWKNWAEKFVLSESNRSKF